MYGSADGMKVDDATIENVLFRANALEFVKKMPQGLDTVVGERGAMLSGTSDIVFFILFFTQYH